MPFESKKELFYSGKWSGRKLNDRFGHYLSKSFNGLQDQSQEDFKGAFNMTIGWLVNLSIEKGWLR